MHGNTVDHMRRIFKTTVNLNDKLIHIWMRDIVFTWQWWITVGLLVLPWAIWLLLRKKESSDRLLYAGLYVFLMTLVLDSLGNSFGSWHYYVAPLPYLHLFYLPWDLTLFPVLTMLFLQYKPHLSPYLKALIYSLGISFIAEPFFVWIRIYDPSNWKHYYSVPFYFVIYLIAHFVSRKKGFDPIK